MIIPDFPKSSLDLPWLASRSRPFFLYDRDRLLRNVDALRRAWSGLSRRPFQLFCSIKANPNLHLARILSERVDGFDVSSWAELQAILSAGIRPDRITLSGPAKTDALLEAAWRGGIRALHLDSVEEYEFLLGRPATGSPPGLSIRIAKPGPALPKLGMAESHVRKLLSSARRRSILGVHAYLGRESFEAARCLDLIESAEGIRREFPEAFSDDFEVYLGAGIPALSRLPSPIELRSDLPFPVHLEAGRSIFSDSAWYGAQVLSVKRDPPRRRAVIVNGGIHHLGGTLISPVLGDRGVGVQAYRASRPLRGAAEPASVYGSLCLATDALHPNLPLPVDLRRGDWILVSQAGAYGLTASACHFIGQDLPDELLFDSGDPVTLESPESISPESFPAYQLSFRR